MQEQEKPSAWGTQVNWNPISNGLAVTWDMASLCPTVAQRCECRPRDALLTYSDPSHLPRALGSHIAHTPAKWGQAGKQILSSPLTLCKPRLGGNCKLTDFGFFLSVDLKKHKFSSMIIKFHFVSEISTHNA